MIDEQFISRKAPLLAGTALTAALLAVGLTPDVSSAQVVVSGAEIVDGTDPTGSGPGSRPSPWTVNDNLWVDDGSLLIRAGGIVFSDEGRIANDLDTVGSVVVTGAGSRWENSGRLIVGNLGSAALMIANGATVANTDGYIGASSGSSTVTVTGFGSRWDNSGRLVIGNSGDGTLTISDGAVVSTDIGVEMGRFGGAGVLNIGAASTDPDDAIAAGFLEAGQVEAFSGPVTINFNHTEADYDFIPSIAGNVTVNHYAGATTLGAISFYSGATNLFGGVLTVSLPDALGVSVLTASGGVLNFETFLSNAIILAGEVDFNVAAGLNFIYGSGTISEDQAGRGFSKTGAGELLVFGTHTFTGEVGIEEGVLAVMGGTVLADTVAVVVEAPGTLRLDDSETIGSLAGAGAVVLGSNTLTLAGDASTAYAGVISGAGGLTKDGAGTLTLTGDNTYGGETVLEGGTLSLGSDTALGASTLTMLGSVLDYADGVTIANPVVIDSDTTQFQVLTGSATQSGVISELNGPRPFEKIGAGELVLTADNLWTGGSRVSAGTLTFDGGSLNLDGRLTVSASGAPTASIIVRNGAQITSDSDLVIGEVARGEMLIEGGADVTAADVVSIADVAGSRGSLTIRGAGSSLTSTNLLFVGTNDEGEMIVENGGRVVSQSAIIGGNVGADGTAVLTGPGTEWVNSGFLEVGRDVSGELVLADGARLQTGLVRLGIFSGGTGVLTIGAGGAAGVVDVGDDYIRGSGGAATVRFNHTELDYVFSSDGTATGRHNRIIDRAAVEHVGTGTTTLGGAHAYTGATTIAAGTLRVNGSLTNEGGLTVLGGGTLAGTGAIGGLTTIEDGGTLAGEAGSVLTLGSLTLGAGSVLDVTLGAPDADAVFDVTGDLVLDGVLDVTDGGGFGAGVYGLIAYGGVLTDNGLVTGDLPVGYTADRLQVQTSVAGRVNLVNAGLADLLFWDGGDPSNADNGAIDGGAGIWTRTSATWTDVDGASNGAMVPTPGLAVFMGTGGTVTLDDSAGALSVTGLQFAADGYSLVGDSLILVEETPGAGVNLRVGDGTAAGANWTAVIDSDLTGAVRLRKTDLGALVLTGDASHTGGTEIAHGELRIGDGGTTGSLTGDVANAGVLTFDRADDVSFGGVISGTGALVQAGAGVLSLTGANTSTGATLVRAGTLDVSSASDRLSDQTALAVAAGATFELGATFQDVGSFAGDGVISGTGGTLSAGMDDRSTAFSGRLLVSTVNLSGTGTLLLSGEHAVDTLRIANTVRLGAGGWSDLTGSDGPVIQMSGGLLDLDGHALLIETLEDLGQPGSVDLGDGGVLTLSDGRTAFRGLISGAGEIIKDGANGFNLAGDLAYDGDLTILNGGVVLGSAATLTGDLALAVSTGARFDLNGTDQRLVGLSGAGQVDLGAGALELALGDAAFGGDFAGTGDITLSDGLLRLNGDSSAFAGTLTVADGATLAGVGAIGGLTAIADGGVLLGVQGQTLGLDGLVLSEGATVAAALGAANGAAALFDVAGDLTLDGDLAVTDLGGFGAGVYRLFDYGGALTDLGLEIASAPEGVDPDDLYVQTAVGHQVNLVSTHDVELRFWDGAGPADDGVLQGGTGVWSPGGREWTGANGAINGVYDNPAFAVFMGTGGIVTVDGPGIGVTGLQFAVDGYQVNGAGIELTGDETIVRVGDGTAAGAAMTAVIASGLSGAGGLVKTDLGTLILTGTNSYTGGTVVRDGTLIGNSASIAGDVVNDATLVFDQGTDAAFTGAISGDGETRKRGAGVLSLLGGSAVDWVIETGGVIGQAGAFSGDAAIASGAGFTLNANGNAVFSGVLSGGGTFAKTGEGGLALTGDSSAFAGLTEVRDGRLVLNGALGGELRLFEGATLGGSGALGRLTAGAGAVIAPGNSIGVLTVTGGVVFETGSIYEVEVDPASDASDRIVAGGTAVLNGGVVRHIGYAGQYRPDSSYVILTAAGGVTGAFDGVQTDFAFLDSSLQYAPNAVSLRLERNDVAFPAVGRTFNQRSTAAAVEATGSGAALYDAVIGQTVDDARFAFDMLSGELHGSIRAAQSEAAQVLAGVLTDRMESARAGDAGAAFWAQAIGSHTRLATDGNAASLTHGVSGLMIGADAAVGAGRLGLAAGTSTHEYDSHTRAGRAEGDSLSLAVYGSGRWGPLGLKGAVSGTWHEVETERLVVFPGFAEALVADHDAETFQAFIEASWRVEMGPAGAVEPFVTLARVRTGSDAFAESGGVAALAVEERVQSVNLATLGIGMSRAFDQGDRRTAVLSGRLGWRHASGDADGEGHHAFAATPTPAGNFVVRGLPMAEDALMAELGLDLDLRDRISLSVDWSAQLASDLSSNALAARLNWRF